MQDRLIKSFTKGSCRLDIFFSGSDETFYTQEFKDGTLHETKTYDDATFETLDEMGRNWTNRVFLTE